MLRIIYVYLVVFLAVGPAAASSLMAPRVSLHSGRSVATSGPELGIVRRKEWIKRSLDRSFDGVNVIRPAHVASRSYSRRGWARINP